MKSLNHVMPAVAAVLALLMISPLRISPATAQDREPSGQDDRADRRERDGQERRPASPDERQEALQHFLAGYYAGYTAGYEDGHDDSALLIVDLAQQHRQRGQRQEGAGRGTAGHYGGLRETRERMRQRMRSRLGPGGPGGSVGRQEISGEVTDVKTIPIRGTDVEHLVVRIRTDFNDRRIADLGPVENLEDVDIQEGARIAVQGHPVRARDFQILAAHSVRIGDETYEVRYRRPKRQDPNRQNTDEDRPEAPGREQRNR